ncbi:tetratricopeptide repeat protein [Streptomyces mirabilis]|uniref:tetratricopeptide repeat protein n=1 Tax=Streptomyces mirabilis TaxID=68239 RepID=UPI003691C42D
MAIGGKRQQEPTDAPDAQLTVTDTGNAAATSGATAVTGYRSPHPETNGVPTVPGVSQTGDATATEGGLANTGYIHTNQLTVVQRRWPREPAAWPHQIGVIPSKAQAFQHRSEANWLRAAIDGGGTAVLGQILTGMGGVGKTQLAADYARTTWKDGSLDLLVWVTASGRSPVVSGYAQAGVELCRANPEDPEQAARAFLAWLTPKAAAEPCRWLIVLDDIADPDDLRDLWPPVSPYGRTLATTRRRDAALTSEGRRRIEVGLFTATESITYLSAFLAGHDRHEPPDQLTALAHDLGHLPLALSQAAAYLIDSGEDVAAYRGLLAARSTALADTAPDRLPDDQATSLAAAWSLSIDRADTLRPVGLARPMLHLAAQLDPNGIPQTVLTSQPALTHLGQHLSGESHQISSRDAVRALRALHRLHLIEHDRDAPHQAVRVHQLIQRATRDSLPHSQRDQMVRTAADAVLAAWPATGVDAAAAARLRANSDAVVHNGEDALYQPTMHQALFRTGKSLGETGQVNAAVEYFSHLLDVAHRCLGIHHPDSLATWRHLATSRAEAGDMAGAVAALESVLEHMLQILGPDHPDTLVTQNNLAKWRGAMGDEAGAVATLELLLEHMLQFLGPDHSDTLTARNDLAWWQGQAGDEAGAIAAFEHLQIDQERVLGRNHPDTLMSAGNLAWCRGAAGDAAKALTELEPLVERTLQALGPDHRTTLATTHTYAIQLAATGNFASAVTTLESVVTRMLRALDPDHPDIFYARSNLATYKAQTGDVPTALAEYEQLLEQAMRVLGSGNRITLYIQQALANCRGEAGDAAGAADAFAELLDSMVRVLGDDHSDVLAARYARAGWQGEAGDAAGAAAAFAELLEDVERVLGESHDDTLATREALAHWQGQASGKTSDS